MCHDLAQTNLLDFAGQLIPRGKWHLSSFLSPEKDACGLSTSLLLNIHGRHTLQNAKRFWSNPD